MLAPQQVHEVHALLAAGIHSQREIGLRTGISRATIGDVHAAGADTFVAGYAIFSARDPKDEIEARIRRVRAVTAREDDVRRRAARASVGVLAHVVEPADLVAVGPDRRGRTGAARSVAAGGRPPPGA